MYLICAYLVIINNNVDNDKQIIYTFYYNIIYYSFRVITFREQYPINFTNESNMLWNEINTIQLRLHFPL